jgi:cytosine/adenosine deaminase-related metal-dependent hydrolase
VCPSSNHFLFGELPDLARLGTLRRVTLGNDSPLTAAGDLLDEIRFTISRCRVTSQAAYQMVTTAAAEILRLGNAEGTLSESGAADLVAIRDTGASPAERLGKLSLEDVEFVMIGGRVQLASERMLERLPREISTGLEPISVGAVNRSVRAPVKKLLRSAEEFLGEDGVRLGGSAVHAPAFAGAHYVC